MHNRTISVELKEEFLASLHPVGLLSCGIVKKAKGN
jgi:hypothetical protein